MNGHNTALYPRLIRERAIIPIGPDSCDVDYVELCGGVVDYRVGVVRYRHFLPIPGEPPYLGGVSVDARVHIAGQGEVAALWDNSSRVSLIDA